MQYQSCRWYDAYPGLAFVLKLIRLLPLEKQFLLGQHLSLYLIHRAIMAAPGEASPHSKGNRWYDKVEPLVESLSHLKTAPDTVKRQSTDFLMRLLEEMQSTPRCA